jgi:hypothetical protein
MKRLSPHTWAIIKIASIALLLLVLLFAILGCESATKRISAGATQVLIEVPRARADLDEIDGTLLGSEYEPMVAPATGRLRGRVDRIEKAAGGIRDQIPDIQDRPTTLSRLLDAMTWWGKALLVIAIVVALWYLGVGFIVRRICLKIGWLIPSGKIHEARMDIKVLAHEKDAGEEGNPAREAIAAKRARDPEYAAAWNKLKDQKEFVS